MSDEPVSGGRSRPTSRRTWPRRAAFWPRGASSDAFGHVSHRHPDAPDRYFMSRSMAPALVTPDDIIEYSLDSVPCDARGRGNFLERFIHGEIYKARPDINSVVHSHSPSVIPFGLVDAEMRAMFHNAAFLAAGVPVFDISEKFGATDMLVSDGTKGVAFADSLGDKDIALMRAHGSVACGPTLQTAVFRAVYTEVNARVQHWTVALSGGGPMAALDEEEGCWRTCPTGWPACGPGNCGAERCASRSTGDTAGGTRAMSETLDHKRRLVRLHPHARTLRHHRLQRPRERPRRRRPDAHQHRVVPAQPAYGRRHLHHRLRRQPGRRQRQATAGVPPPRRHLQGAAPTSTPSSTPTPTGRPSSRPRAPTTCRSTRRGRWSTRCRCSIRPIRSTTRRWPSV